MKRSEINAAIHSAKLCFTANGWALPPTPRWDVTDFGLGAFKSYGLILVNLAEEVEYCEKLMYDQKGQTTPCHAHKNKKEDIICRFGELHVQVWNGIPRPGAPNCELKINGVFTQLASGEVVKLSAGERITLTPGIYHEFAPASDECIIGEVSTYNDDETDNFFINKDIGRYATIDEDEAPNVKLVSDK
ncbi:MAG: D-lyxose/D-mannose family sugar isomerase [Cyclobacteriaceae bacterium]